MSSQIGNVISRLAGLKNVSGRRRVSPELEYIQSLEEPEMDVSGTAPELPEFRNLLPANQPQEDLGGEITPQSYDVRANAVEKPQEEGFGSSLRRLGENLAQSFKQNYTPGIIPQEGIAQKPPVETAQVDQAEGLPPVTASEQEEGVLGKLGSYLGNRWNERFSPIVPEGSVSEYLKPFQTEGHYYGELTPERQELKDRAELMGQGLNPEQYRAEQAQTQAATQDAVMNKIDKALENPTTTAVYGASDIVANQPDLQAGFKKITGIDFTEEIARQTKEFEKILDDMNNQNDKELAGYTEQEKRILQRIQNNQATDADKFYVGLAVMLPLLVGAFYGKEAALGALGGAGQGIANVLGQRQKDIREDEKMLADIQSNKGNLELKKGELALKKLALPAEIKKNLPEDPEEHLKGKKRAHWIDPQTGQERDDGIEIRPGLVARPEFITNKEEVKEVTKEAQELAPAINATREINTLTNDILDISSRMKDKNIVGKALATFLNGKDPGLASKTGEQIEFNGRMVNSYIVLEHKLKLLVDAYRQAKGMRALTQTVQDHIDGLFRNPAASFQNYNDTKDQMLYTRSLAQERLLNNVNTSPFVPELVIKQLQPEVKSTYNMLNTREGEKESAELLR